MEWDTQYVIIHVISNINLMNQFSLFIIRSTQAEIRIIFTNIIFYFKSIVFIKNETKITFMH